MLRLCLVLLLCGSFVKAAPISVGVNAVSVVLSNASLLLTAPTNISKITTAGYFTAGDGGGSDFVWFPGDTTVTNHGHVWSRTGLVGKWKSTERLIRARSFGAIPGDLIDDATAIQKAIAYAASIGGGTVEIGSGTNLYSKTIWLKSNVRLVGESEAILHRVAGMDDSRPRESGTNGLTNPGLFITLGAVSRYYYTTGIYTNSATPVPDSTYQGPHTNIYISGITIYGTKKSAGNVHQISSGNPITGDINSVCAIQLDDCSDATVENVMVPFAAEQAIEILGNTSVQDGGSANNIRIINLTGKDVGMLAEAQEGAQSVTFLNPVGTEVYIHGLRMTDVRSSTVIGGSIGACPNGNALYYAKTGVHLAFGVSLKKTNSAELAVRIDGGTEHVFISGCTIYQGQVSRSIGTSGVVVLSNNRWLNQDFRRQGTNISDLFQDATGFVYLPQTQRLYVDELFPITTNNSRYQHVDYAQDINMSFGSSRFNDSVFIGTNWLSIGTPNSLADGLTVGSPFGSFLGIVPGSGNNGLWLVGDVGITNYAMKSSVTNKTLNINRPLGNNLNVLENDVGPQMTILSGGNVGIGTDTPDGRLHVESTSLNAFFRGSVGAGYSRIFIHNDADQGLTPLVYGSSFAGTSWGFGKESLATLTSDVTNAFVIGTVTSQPMGFVTADTLRMIVLANGNVGIGTNSPQTSLHVHGSVTVTNDVYDATVWNGNLTVPNKDAIRDKIESMGSGSGETNTASSLGAGWPVTAGKSGVDLRFNSITNGNGAVVSSNANLLTVSANLVAGANVTLTTNAQVITISAATNTGVFRLYSATASGEALTGTTEESLLTKTVSYGSLTIPANTLNVGSIIRFTLRGSYSTDVTPGTLVIKEKFAGTTIDTSDAVTLPASITDAFCELIFDMIVISSGGEQVLWSGKFAYETLAGGLSVLNLFNGGGGSGVIDRAVSNAVDLTGTLSSAGNQIAFITIEVELIK